MNVDRRQKPRLCEPIPVEVRMRVGNGSYKFHTLAKNISAGGMYTSAPRTIDVGTKLRFRIRFSREDTDPAHAPEASAQGTVIRTEKHPDGSFHFAVSFTRCRVL